MSGVPRNSLNYSLEAGAGKNSIKSDGAGEDVPIRLINSTSGDDPTLDMDTNTAGQEKLKKPTSRDNTLNTIDLPGIITATEGSRRFKKLSNMEELDSRASLLSNNKNRSFLKREA